MDAGETQGAEPPLVAHAQRPLSGDDRAVRVDPLRGALCDQQTKNALQQIGEAFDWAALAAAGQP